MEIFHLQHYLHHFSSEEIAEEFGIARPVVEKEIITAIGKSQKASKEGEESEKRKKLQSKPTHSSR
ncbi:hypothetical protein H1D32_20140 [Anaerobacillus sp. CMMVII]|uniref:hypothetical protein n=1 Tax=Anaerobacillus sp. CMMVII TaxID=2755588 RepID=UPI0021B7AE4B|nr:hypothetical protein [Anaerobacillus sp. CMMVII]MCT8139809.1 hypothetical protein [Anaerobacillus sp. CMMVII]